MGNKREKDPPGFTHSLLLTRTVYLVLGSCNVFVKWRFAGPKLYFYTGTRSCDGPKEEVPGVKNSYTLSCVVGLKGQ